MKRFWKHDEVWADLKQWKYLGSEDVCMRLMALSDRGKAEEFACRVWSLWGGGERCCVVHSDERRELRDVSMNGRVLLREYKRAVLDFSLPIIAAPLPSPYIWSLPPTGQFRLDVDASFDEENNRYGIGGIVRD